MREVLNGRDGRAEFASESARVSYLEGNCRNLLINGPLNMCMCIDYM